MVAFENAVALGVDHLETDVHASADGVVHCFHDHTLERITGVEGMFSNQSALEIGELDAGFNHRAPDGFEFRGTGVRVPTFEELVLSFPDVQIVVDLKDDDVVEPFARLVEQIGVGHRLLVGSFSDERLERLRQETAGNLATSTGYSASRRWLISSRQGRPFPGPASALQLPVRSRGLRVVDERLVDVAHGAGLQVHVWTVNEVARMEELISLGVDGLITDRPDLAVAVLNR